MTTKVWRSSPHSWPWCLQSRCHRSKVKWLKVTLTMYCYCDNFSCSTEYIVNWLTQKYVLCQQPPNRRSRITWSNNHHLSFLSLDMTSLIDNAPSSMNRNYSDLWYYCLVHRNLLLEELKFILSVGLDSIRWIIRSNVWTWLCWRYQYPQCSELPNLWWEMEQSFLNWANYASPGGASF